MSWSLVQRSPTDCDASLCDLETSRMRRPRPPLGGIMTFIGGRLVHETATYKCHDTRDCVMQFWPPDDEHICSKHVEAWNKLTVKQKYCASSWLITEIKALTNQFQVTPKLMLDALPSLFHVTSRYTVGKDFFCFLLFNLYILKHNVEIIGLRARSKMCAL